MNNTKAVSPVPVAVLISGGGTTLKNLIEYQQAGNLQVDFRLVISSRANVGGLEIASDAAIPTQILSRREHPEPQAYSQAIFQACRDSSVDLVIMGGFLQHVLIPDDFEARVMNIHPGLIPSFCGKGFYGHHVHQAALDYGVKLSGCTVHFVDNDFDHGPVILQRACPVHDTDTADILAARVFEQECEAFPAAINLYAQRRLSLDGRIVRVTA